MGPFIVTDAGFVLPEKEPDPFPVQPVKPKPAFGLPLIATFCPALNQLLAGAAVPPLPLFIVRKN
jgi:hypothetical protein